MVSFRKPPRQSNMAKCKILYLLKFDVFPVKPSIYGRFPTATFDNRRGKCFFFKKTGSLLSALPGEELKWLVQLGFPLG